MCLYHDSIDDFACLFRKTNKLFYSHKSNIPEIIATTKGFDDNILIKPSKSQKIKEIDQWIGYGFKHLCLKKRYFKCVTRETTLDIHNNATLLFKGLLSKFNLDNDLHAFCYFCYDMFTNKVRLFNLADIDEIYLTDNPDVIVRLINGDIFYIEFCLANKNESLGPVKGNIKKHIGKDKIGRSIKHKCKGKCKAKNKIYILGLQTKVYPRGAAYSLSSHPKFIEIKKYIELKAKPRFIDNTKKYKCWQCCFKYV